MLRSAQPDGPADGRDNDRVDDRADDQADYRSSSVDGLDGAGVSSCENSVLDETELDSALQLLVERAQYITGSTGAALALPQGEEMVCRASAGTSAPAVGARLQVRSGLTAESIARRQLLRCNNAESDPRVNLEACRALGIASIVVLPLLHRTGEVRGLFELFSDHPYAFEERDLIALERMADLTVTALDLAEQSANLVPAFVPALRQEPAKSAQPVPEFSGNREADRETDPSISGAPKGEAEEPIGEQQAPATSLQSDSLRAETADAPQDEQHDHQREERQDEQQDEQQAELVGAQAGAVVPEAMLRGQKCDSCGFPVSEGRTLCLDCEKKDAEKNPEERRFRVQDAQPESEFASASAASASSSAQAQDEDEDKFVPAFLANSASTRVSWMSNHVNLLAIVVLILGILVAVVVFR
jgi:hypothetical protein